MPAETDMNGELKDLKSNARNLEECLRTLVRRIDELESRKGAGDPTTLVSSPRSEAARESRGLGGWGDPYSSLRAFGPRGGDITKLVPGTPRDENPPISFARTETVVSGDGTKKTFLTQQFISSTKTYSSSNAAGTISSFLLGGGDKTNGGGKMDSVVVGVRKKKGDSHLGLTVKEEGGQLMVARILNDSPLAKQEVVRVGDVIVDVNGSSVSSAEELQTALKAAGEGVQLRILPSGVDRAPPPDGSYVKAHVDFDPATDAQIPCKDIGLAFKVGDILQVISKDDPQWWQARNVREWSRIGLIPSQSFEESRKAGSGVDAARKQALGGLVSIHKRRKVMYKSEESSAFEGNALQVYEEVGKLSPYGRRVVVLVGAPGVGRRTLKAMLLAQCAGAFATVVPYTSRPPKAGEVEGREYNFKTHKELQKDVDSGAFLEWGEFNGNIYGTTLQSIRKIVKTGRMCVLDCSPQAIKWVYNDEFMPYVVYVGPPPMEELRQLYKVHPNRTKPKTEADLKATVEAAAEMEAAYAPLFDLHLVNRNVDVTFRRLTDALESLKTETQWVPINWLYG